MEELDLCLTYNVRRYWRDPDGLIGIRRGPKIEWFRFTDAGVWELVRTTPRREVGSGASYHDVSGRRL